MLPQWCVATTPIMREINCKKKSYIDISNETGASTATISRVSKCLYYGKGGYDIVLEDGDI